MPVLDHSVHVSTSISDSKPYGCMGYLIKSVGYFAPNRVLEWTPKDSFSTTFKLGVVWVENRMSRDCRYDLSHTDQRCTGCSQQGLGKKYADEVKATGN